MVFYKKITPFFHQWYAAFYSSFLEIKISHTRAKSNGIYTN